MGTIRIADLSKVYRHYPSRWARLAEWILPSKKIRHTPHQVLCNINLNIDAGEAIGIVGINGAGKSTLLKIIAGTTHATTGTIDINGRVTALLELGMGFHPDFTGRQNIFMAGQLIGLSREELHDLLPEIETFAGIGAYIDQPLRVYSSGMQMRLAFSLATAKRPDVLIIDEALSVGDSFFQHKSFARIRQFRAQGTTLLIVSHDRYAIQTICDRAVLIHDGGIALQGNPEDVLDYYHAAIVETEAHTIRQIIQADGALQTISGTAEAAIEEVTLLDKTGAQISAIEVGADVILRVQAAIRKPVPRLVLGFMIKDRFGQPIYGINSHRLNQPIEYLSVGEKVIYKFAFPLNIGKGTYSIALSLSQFDSHLDKNYEWRDRALMFEVINIRNENFVGSAWLNARTSIERIAADTEQKQ